MRDVHYTPDWMADQLASSIDEVLAGVANPLVADYAAGDGSLLGAVGRRFDGCTLLATDIDRRVVRRLRSEHPTWHVGVCDLLSTRSRARSRLVDSSALRPRAVVMNPPYSYRGAAAYTVLGHVRASPAVACLIVALEQVSDGGTVSALLPAGCLTSQKDEGAWSVIRTVGSVSVVESYGRGSFPGVAAAVRLVSVRSVNQLGVGGVLAELAGEPGVVEGTRRSRDVGGVRVGVHRGCVPMHMAETVEEGDGKLLLVHSTDLQRGELRRSRWVESSRRVLRGPAVLVPRVGAPRPDKVVVVAEERLVLSDCVFGITCDSLAVCQSLALSLQDCWDSVASRYVGSCAPYLTTRDLACLLRRMGYAVEA